VPQVREANLGIRAKARTSGAHTRKARHPEQNEVKPKDLHFLQPSTTHQETKTASQSKNRAASLSSI